MTRYRVAVHGTPATKGSMKCIGGRGRVKHQLIEDDDKGARKEWRVRVAKAAEAVLAEAGAPLDGPVGLWLTFTVPRPPSAPRRRVWPVTRSSGDVDKLTRLVLDAITDAGLWGDDSQCCRVTATKAYVGHPTAAPQPGVKILIWSMDDEQQDEEPALPISSGSA